VCAHVCMYPAQAAIKPQYVDQIPKAVKGTVQAMLDRKDELQVQESVCNAFGMQCKLLACAAESTRSPSDRSSCSTGQEY